MKPRPVKIKESDIETALRATHGNILMSAQALGCDRNTIYARIAQSPHLQQVKEESRETVIDIAESNIHKAVESGDISASKYILGTIGRNRGYIEKHDVEVSGGFTVIVEGDDAEL